MADELSDAARGAPLEDSQEPGKLATVVGVALLVPLTGLGGLVLYRIYPARVREKASPGFIDNIFANNLVVFAMRLVILSAALVFSFVGSYTIVSVINWMRRRQWLSKAGSFEVSRETIEELEALARFWEERATAAVSEVQELRGEFEASKELIAALLKPSTPAS
jgi:hypothetical protein